MTTRALILGPVSTSPELSRGEWATLSASRTEGDIAYAVAFTKVKDGRRAPADLMHCGSTTKVPSLGR